MYKAGLRLSALVAVCALINACDSGSNNSFPAIPGTEIIEPFLGESRFRSIQLGSGDVAVTQGDWKRFGVDDTWAWQLRGVNGAVNIEYEADVYIVDMFAQLQTDSISPLKDMGRKVVCYFSAGTYEPWRPDARLFSAVELGNPHNYYPDERWLDINDPLVIKLMVNRMDMAVAIGCDAVELDNVDGWIPSANAGFNFTLDDQKKFAKILANEAHKRNLAVALKNNVELIEELSEYFDMVINEECFQYNECDGYAPMISKGKPVFNAEYKVFDSSGNALLPVIDYPNERSEICQRAAAYGFQTQFLPLALDGTFRLSCR